MKHELQHLQNTFEANGYLSSLVQCTLNRTTPPAVRETDQEDDEDKEKPKLLVLPYLKDTSKLIERICKPLGVRAVFKSWGTLHQTLTRVNTARPDMMKKDVIYEVPCMDCNMSYIGETGRNLQKRLVEHKAAVTRGDHKNGIAVHVQDYNHRVNWEGARIINQEASYWPRRIR